ncbi:MAG: PP2C family protein-serine/threonine phosphatase [Candidatus Woesearchaeota archaeon]
MKLEIITALECGKNKDMVEDALSYHKKTKTFTLADGITKSSRSYLASNIATTMIQQDLKSMQKELIKDNVLNDEDVLYLFEKIIKDTDKFIYEGSKNTFLKGTGTTIDAGIIHNHTFFYAHAGDGRIYLFRDGQLKQLTEDHILFPENIAEKDKETYALTGKLNNYVGRGDASVDTGKIKLKNNDIIWMQTDGISKVLTNAELESHLNFFNNINFIIDKNKETPINQAMNYCNLFNNHKEIHNVYSKLKNDDKAYIGIKITQK